jgi:hypothetical protein
MASERALHLRAIGTPGRLTIARIDLKDPRDYLEIEQMLLLAAMGVVTGVAGCRPAIGPCHVRAVQIPIS